MGFRFRRTMKIAPGVRLNISKSGPSISFGPRGAKVTIGKDRITRTVGIPGTGISYTDIDRVGGKRKRGRRKKNDNSDNYNDVVGTDSSNIEQNNNEEDVYNTSRPKTAGCFTIILCGFVCFTTFILCIF